MGHSHNESAGIVDAPTDQNDPGQEESSAADLSTTTYVAQLPGAIIHSCSPSLGEIRIRLVKLQQVQALNRFHRELTS